MTPPLHVDVDVRGELERAWARAMCAVDEHDRNRCDACSADIRIPCVNRARLLADVKAAAERLRAVCS